MKKLALIGLVWVAFIAVALAQTPAQREKLFPPPAASPFPTGHVMTWEEYWAKYPKPVPPHPAHAPATPVPTPVPNAENEGNPYEGPFTKFAPEEPEKARKGTQLYQKK